MTLIRREELLTASLDFGSTSIDLADYATTGLRVVAVGPSGIGKTCSGLVIAEQLSTQGWVSVLIDPEGELASLYPGLVDTPDALQVALEKRTPPIVVAPARTAAAFVPFAERLLAVVDQRRQPVFVMLDEGQLFSTSRRTKGAGREASDLVNEFMQRGRKRALDVCLTAFRFSDSLHRAVFTNRNLTLIGRQEDAAAWSALAPHFKGSGVTYADTAALGTGEFFCFSRRGVEKVQMPLAIAMRSVALAATSLRPLRPTTFAQWDAAMGEIPVDRLRALDGAAIALLAEIAGVTASQLSAGTRALEDELATRALS